jgi:predicted transcriptional regulator
MPKTSLTKPELQIMEALWTRGACSIREIHEALPAKGRPAFTTVQTVVYRLEKKGALRRVKRISNATIVEAVISVTMPIPRWLRSCSACSTVAPSLLWLDWSNPES